MTHEENLQKVLDAARLLAITLDVDPGSGIQYVLSEGQRQAVYTIRNLLGCTICGQGIDVFPVTVCHGEEAHGPDKTKDNELDALD